MCRPVTLAIYSISAMAAAVTAATAEAVAVQQVFNFSSYVSTENSILRPNGHILLYVSQIYSQLAHMIVTTEQ